MSVRKTSADLEAQAKALEEKLKEVRKEARKARRVEKAKAERERIAQEKEEAYELIQIAKQHTITAGERKLSVYDFLKELKAEQK